MLTANLILDGSAGADTTFNLRRYLTTGLGGADRYNIASNLETFRIAHQETGKAATLVKRHLTSVVSPVLANDGVTYLLQTANLTFAVPGDCQPATSFTAAKNALAFMISLYCGAFSTTTGLGANVTNLQAILNGES